MGQLVASTCRDIACEFWHGLTMQRYSAPGTAGGTVRRSARTVAAAMSWAEAGAALDTPGITMLGFRSVPSSSTWWSLSACRAQHETLREQIY